MKIHTVEQGTLEWLQLRLGKVTASELGNLLTPLFKIKTGTTPHTYLCEKVAETWRGQPLPGFGSWATDQGSIKEADAIPFFEFEENCEVQRVGFVEHDDGRCGCSPDGLIGEDGGLEIKCPQPVNHVKYLLDGVVPEQYITQVHGCLYVTGRKWWKFMSYHPDYPPLIVTVQRNESICEKIAEAIAQFSLQFDDAMEQMKLLENKQ